LGEELKNSSTKIKEKREETEKARVRVESVIVWEWGEVLWKGFLLSKKKRMRKNRKNKRITKGKRTPRPPQCPIGRFEKRARWESERKEGGGRSGGNGGAVARGVGVWRKKG